jgi:hypothetical protein
VTAALLIYTAGAAIALLRTDARWLTRVVLALLWPVGPLAFVVTVSLLLGVSLFVFPLFGLVVAAGLALWMVWG